MADEHKLPAQIAARALAPAEQAGSLVARGLEAIKNRQRSLASVGVEADPEKSFREGVEAYKRRDFAEAVKRYRRAADQGHALAPFNLALMYDKGQGVPQDDAAAVSWYRKGAAQVMPARNAIWGPSTPTVEAFRRTMLLPRPGIERLRSRVMPKLSSFLGPYTNMDKAFRRIMLKLLSGFVVLPNGVTPSPSAALP